MRLLLRTSIQNLGLMGEIVKVKDGYGRNFLIPQGYAVEATPDNLARFEGERRRLIAQEKATREKMQLLAKELEGSSCTIIARSTEEGHLFGSVSARDIAAQFTADGIDVDPKTVLLEEPIKELGIYKVVIRLHPEIEATTKVWVVKGDDSGEPILPREAEEAEQGTEGE
ncbi:MAG: 50S ribosomal protein L9 [Planctomycetes bacterium]|nr:50S ribosomal protein L9 [Planctomycetota bacterium]